MDCKDGGYFTIQDDVTLRFVDGPCQRSPPLLQYLAELSKICSMNPGQIVTLLSSDHPTIVADADSNAWLTVSTTVHGFVKAVALTVCRVKFNGHDDGAAVDHFPVSLRDSSVSYSFCLWRRHAAWLSARISNPPFPFTAPGPLLSVSMIEPGIRQIGRCDQDGYGRSTHRDALTDFVLEQTHQTQVLEFGKGRMGQPESRASSHDHDVVDLTYIYCPGSGNECFLAMPYSRYVRGIGHVMAQWCLGLPAGSCSVDRLNSRAHRGQNQKHNSGWTNLEWDGMILDELRKRILPVLADVISGYVGEHSVPIEPQGEMIRRCRAFDSFCEKHGVVPDWAWYEWAVVAASMAESLDEGVSLWLDAFDYSKTEDRSYHIKFGDQTSSLPVTRSVAIAVGAMKLRDNGVYQLAIVKLIGTAIDTNGSRLALGRPLTVSVSEARAKRPKLF